MDAVRQRFCPPSLRRPCRVAREQAVHKPDLVDDHRTEDDACKPGHDGERSMEPREPSRRRCDSGIASAVVMSNIPAIVPTPKTSR